MRRLIYLHGFASGPTSGKAGYFREKLGLAGVQVEVPALDGGQFERITITSQLDVVEQAAGSGPVALMGSSLGGYLAALYAARHPEVERLVLMAPAFGFAKHFAEHLGARQVEQWRQTGFMQTLHYGENRMRALSYALLEDGQRYEEYPDFKHPALIFHGAYDEVVPVTYSQEFAADRSNVRLEVLPSDHGLFDALEFIAPKVVEFLTKSG